MKSRPKHITLFFSILIAAGFAISGYHFHDHRNFSDILSNEASITTVVENCLFCEAVFLTDFPEIPTDFSLPRQTDLLKPKPDYAASASFLLLPGNRAPPRCCTYSPLLFTGT